jgi:hypothetical protein
MQRIIHRQVTTIQITSIEVLWDDDRHPFPHEIVDGAIIAPMLPEPETRKKSKKTKPRTRKKAGARKKKSSPSKRVQGEIVKPSEFILKIQE